jgi:hypothetical protein
MARRDSDLGLDGMERYTILYYLIINKTFKLAILGPFDS